MEPRPWPARQTQISTVVDPFEPLRLAISSALAVRQLPRDERVWLAISGGLDSMALLEAAGTMQGRFGVLHVDHGLHPGSAEIKDFVGAAALRLDLPFEHHTLTGLQDGEARRKHGLEAAARSARYAWMAHTVGKGGAVLTAHHADDQRETRLLHLLRGSRPEAMTAMKPWTEDWGFALGRPFLALPKSALRAALQASGKAWREDPTNLQPDFLRNRIRHELVPLHDSIRPGWESGLKRMGDLASEWRNHAEGLHSSLGTDNNTLPISLLQDAPSPTHFMGIWGQSFGFGAAQAGALVELAQPTTEVGRKRCSDSHCIVRERDALVAHPVAAHKGRDPRSWSPLAGAEHGAISTPDGTLTWWIETPADGFAPDAGDNTADVDMDAVHWPLTLRPWTDGDRMSPLGMKGSQNVSDILTQRKVPASQRQHQWLLLNSAGQPLWLVGHRIDRRAALPLPLDKGQYRRLLRMSWKALR